MMDTPYYVEDDILRKRLIGRTFLELLSNYGDFVPLDELAKAAHEMTDDFLQAGE
jgi:hypothetical protein